MTGRGHSQPEGGRDSQRGQRVSPARVEVPLLDDPRHRGAQPDRGAGDEPRRRRKHGHRDEDERDRDQRDREVHQREAPAEPAYETFT